MVDIKSESDIQKMRVAGKLASEVLEMIEDHVVPGTTTGLLDEICHDYIVQKQNAIPAPLNYKGFPKSICTSVNHVVCHGIPSNKILDKGDIINIDVTVILDGWYGDTSRMFIVGENTSVKANNLIEITYKCMMEGIKKIKPGLNLGDIGYTIENIAEKNKFSVVKDFCGHGIGKDFHEAPSILHYGTKGQGVKLKQGMIFTIEPMLNVGTDEVKILNDGWTAVTKDKSLSAQFEHTVGVTENGFEIFTKSKKKYDQPPYTK